MHSAVTRRLRKARNVKRREEEEGLKEPCDLSDTYPLNPLKEVMLSPVGVSAVPACRAGVGHPGKATRGLRVKKSRPSGGSEKTASEVGT
ncbi:hypothetical protein EYF80_018794 [Liparis tanakae]|uniref:Uncharacterized protein n=1 Tax=Liparis tanakae TaxID=230148 RepID=A0A4Z2HZ83_9TELE|nr:hypothetical protein EYF80_018794 [Liparis tanakae]